MPEQDFAKETSASLSSSANLSLSPSPPDRPARAPQICGATPFRFLVQYAKYREKGREVCILRGDVTRLDSNPFEEFQIFFEIFFTILLFMHIFDDVKNACRWNYCGKTVDIYSRLRYPKERSRINEKRRGRKRSRTLSFLCTLKLSTRDSHFSTLVSQNPPRPDSQPLTFNFRLSARKLQLSIHVKINELAEDTTLLALLKFFSNLIRNFNRNICINSYLFDKSSSWTCLFIIRILPPFITDDLDQLMLTSYIQHT